jgi:hypothetical protein
MNVALIGYGEVGGKVPLLLGGPGAAALLPLLADLGFAPKIASDQLGVASATKMCRRVMIKGLEAMVSESFTTARHYGVEDAVLSSLKVAQTVREAGLEPLFAFGPAQRQAFVADAADAGVFGMRGAPGFARSADGRMEADRMLAAVRAERILAAAGADRLLAGADQGAA